MIDRNRKYLPTYYLQRDEDDCDVTVLWCEKEVDGRLKNYRVATFTDFALDLFFTYDEDYFEFILDGGGDPIEVSMSCEIYGRQITGKVKAR